MDFSSTDRTIYETNSILKPCLLSCKKPMTTNEVLNIVGHLITPKEITQVKQYNEIYYLGKLGMKPDISHNIFVTKNQFKLVQNDHLGFRYEILRIIHDGKYSTVILTYDHRTRIYNYTSVVPNVMQLQTFVRNPSKEVAILRLLTENDPFNTFNINPLVSYFTFQRMYCMCFPPWGKSLKTLLKEDEFKNGFSCDQVKNYATQILHALMYMHDSKIIHCDIKPGKIVTEVGNPSKIKIIGFHDSRFFEDYEHAGLQTLNYRSPELLLGMRASKAIDMWSFGCTLYELATGKTLFRGTDEYTQLQAILGVKGLPPIQMMLQNSSSEIQFDSSEISAHQQSMLIEQMKMLFPAEINLLTTPNIFPETETFKALLKMTEYGRNFLDLVDRCTDYLPPKRALAVEALLSPWIQYNLKESKFRSYITEKHSENIISNNNSVGFNNQPISVNSTMCSSTPPKNQSKHGTTDFTQQLRNLMIQLSFSKENIDFVTSSGSQNNTQENCPASSNIPKLGYFFKRDGKQI